MVAVFLALAACAPAWSAPISCPDGLRTAAAADRRVSIAVPETGDDMGEAAATHAALQAALTRARSLDRPRIVELAAGDYYLQEPLRLAAADGGTILASSSPGAAVLHGGVDLTARHWTRAENGIYWTQLDRAALPHGIEALYLDGEPQTMARYPNAKPGDATSGWLFAAPGTGGYQSLHFKPGSIPAGLASRGLRIWITDANQWTSNIARVASIDWASGTVTLGDNVPWHQLGESSRFFLLGTRGALDAAGEWAYDAASARLYWKPTDPSALNGGHKVTAGTADTLIDVEGADDVAVCGLTLVDGTPHGSDRGDPYYQIGGGAIRAFDTNGLRLEGNAIRNVGVGINALGARHAVIRDNKIGAVAGNGIKLGMPEGGTLSTAVEITGNRISDVGQVFIESAGIWFGGTTSSLIAGNKIARAAQFGIYGGQIKDTGEDPIRGNTITNNVIRGANLATADGGGIKLYAATRDGSSDNSITRNWVDGVTQLMSRPDGTFFAADEWAPDRWPQPIAAGLYLDWNSRATTIADNVVTHSWGGVQIVNGDGTRVHNNLIYGGYGAAFEVTQQPDPKRTSMGDNLFTDNIAMRNDPHAAAVKIYDADGGPAPVSFVGNVYWGRALDGRGFYVQSGNGAAGLSGGFERWDDAGYAASDEHEVDPRMIDPTAGDFRLRPTSPLPRLGIAPLPAALLDEVRVRSVASAGRSDAAAVTWARP